MSAEANECVLNWATDLFFINRSPVRLLFLLLLALYDDDDDERDGETIHTLIHTQAERVRKLRNQLK